MNIVLITYSIAIVIIMSLSNLKIIKSNSTRKSSEMVLEVVNPVLPETIGGSADLTGSNNTLTKGLGVFDAENRAGAQVTILKP